MSFLNRILRGCKYGYNHQKLMHYNSLRTFAIQSGHKTEYASAEDLNLLRNIGISAHIDSGKTTTTERILFYTGRINEIHEVRGKDGVGAKMDSMDLEREKGITIKSAATHTEWKDGYHINIIDTPGHVDFTIEVERSLQVLDGAIMLVCASSGVQSQTITVDRQMKRYNVPRICFINKCDRSGARPYQVLNEIKDELGINVAFVQIPIGIEDEHKGIIDIIEEKAIYFDGKNGEIVRKEDIPSEYLDKTKEYRHKLLESLGEIDETMEMHYLEETYPSIDEIKSCIKKCVIANTFVPIFVGSAYKNKGIQTLLDGVIDYLPSPIEKTHYAKNPENGELQALTTNKDDPLLFLAFKLEESQYGQLTWCRVYQGTLKRGVMIEPNVDTNKSLNMNIKKTRLARLVRMHSSEIQDIQTAHAGDICAMFGIDCFSGTTFSDGRNKCLISDLYIPNTVVSLSVKAKKKQDMDKFSKAYNRFQKEDPTFKVYFDNERSEAIFNGMGELHLQIYIERILREYNVETIIGKPRVNYKESITSKLEFDYQYKKQTGGSGQYARIIGYMEPIDNPANAEPGYIFSNEIRNNSIPPNFIKSIDVGFKEMLDKGPLVGGKINGLKVVIQDGVTHEVDSSDLAFRLAAQGAFRENLNKMIPRVSEPYMNIEIIIPEVFKEEVVGNLVSKGLLIQNISHSGKNCIIKVYGALDKMFGYATILRSFTQGKGEFSMEYADHQFVDESHQLILIDEYTQWLKTNQD